MIDGLQAKGRAEPRADARRPRLPARRVRRRRSRRTPIGLRAQLMDQLEASARDAPTMRLYTGGRSESGLEDPRVGAARRRQRPWHAAAMGRLGRCGGRAGEARAPTCAICGALLDEYQYQAAYYGHFGHGCIHMQVSFDLQSERRRPQVRRVRRSRRRSGRELRRLAVRRARRRPVARRAAAEDVRPRADDGVPRVQGGLGSGRTG